ncbi:tigger transposable element-derived protein 1-like, partial [Stegodyphus dumicola]|uniref:tigger transposable element-derived protein 1-like n=1 Tax=Stegodyphus dumicola TaxID=202533 RepID=UPI0015AEDD4A
MGDNEKEKKATRKSISLKLKMEVIRRLDSGERQTLISASLNLPTSTIRTIMKNKEKILSSATATTSSSATKITRSRNNIIEEMEKRLSIWIDDEIDRNMPLSQSIIMEKARRIFYYIQAETIDKSETFVASRRWFNRFKHRNNLHNIKITGEAASGDTKAAAEFPAILKKKIIEEGNYPPELVFNVDETGLFWKRMPKRTFLSREEKRAPGFKAAKDRLTLLLGGNASGDFKLKPLLIYHSKNPRAMKGISKSTLLVIWESNKKSWITAKIFQDWFTEHFCPSVKRYCKIKKLEQKALLLIDNAPSHPTNLSDLTTCIPVEVVFLPPNTTALIQPMDQGVISNFKAYYLRRTFKQMFEKTDGEENQSIREFWKNYNIVDAVENIGLSWNEVTERSLKGVWKNIWPDLSKSDDVGHSVDVDEIVEEIVKLTKQTGFEGVNVEDVVEIIQEAAASLSNDELKELTEQEENKNVD